jgi:peptidoglycan/LPS O-acetylase OafA/YrhL
MYLLDRLFGAPRSPKRFGSLDGLRGYAAFLVFLHHSAIWYFFARSGVWELPPSRLYTHFGQSAVAMFFMITALLFWSKLIDGRTHPIAWPRLFVSRLLRLTPLFWFVVLILWVVAFTTSGFVLRVSVPRAMLDTAKWLAFTVPGMPDLNRAPTSLMAGVAWSLPYEWWFYLSLPFAALLFRRRQPWGWLVLGLVSTALGIVWVSDHAGWPVASAFLGGIAAAFAVRHAQLCEIARYPAASIVCIASLAAATRWPTIFMAAPMLLLFLGFAIIACGNTLFGALDWPPARSLGEMGYSVYLLNGLVLFLAFEVIMGIGRTAALSPAAHWLVVYLCVPIVLAVSYLTFHTIEAPARGAVGRVSAWLEGHRVDVA